MLPELSTGGESGKTLSPASLLQPLNQQLII